MLAVTWMVLTSLGGGRLAEGGDIWSTVVPEQQTLVPQEPVRYQAMPLPTERPRTVRSDQQVRDWQLTLDDALLIALQNAEVIRVSAGIGVSTSGRTIYDVAIANAKIDSERARFDPTLSVENTWARTETPTAGIIVPNPSQRSTTGFQTDVYRLDTALEKLNVFGGVTRFEVGADISETDPRVARLNPQERSDIQLSYVQPLLQGRGKDVNLAPIVIARLDTSRSYFQLQNSVQDLVYGVIEAYWNVVAARVDVWARKQQVEQGRFAYDRAIARQKRGLADSAEVTQTRLAYTNFQAALITVRGQLLDRENILRNLLFLPASGSTEIKPTTIPHTDRINFEWDQLVELADCHRPDLKDLRTLIAIDQRRIRALENLNQPRLDAVAQYRWNTLSGDLYSTFGSQPPTSFATRGSEFTDWTLGINFSVPLGDVMPAPRFGARN